MGDSRGQVRRITGDFFIHIGAGGALLSLFWDVVYRGRPLDTGAIGPFKLAGIGAGLVIMLVGLWLRFGRTGEAAPRPAPLKRPRRAEAPPDSVFEVEEAAGKRVFGAGEAAGGVAPEAAEAAGGGAPGAAPEEIAEAIPVAEAVPVEEGPEESATAGAHAGGEPSGAKRRP